MISAKIIAHSRCKHSGQEIVTFELEYPRFIHSEFMTHRLFSRNAMSSRAVPVEKMIEQVKNNPAMPIHWGANEPGMQASKSLSDGLIISAKWLWEKAAKYAANMAGALHDVGLHKQVANRILEPFQTMKTVVTATSYDNWFWLRKHADAQPEIKALADAMWYALQDSYPAILDIGDWHVPYFGAGYWLKGCGIRLQDALAISSSCCAQVSYRKLDDTLEKAERVFARLVESKPVHASPFEHQATPMKFSNSFQQTFSCINIEPENLTQSDVEWEEGITHLDRQGDFWSGNFKGFIQHRQLIPDNTCWNYEENV